MVAGGQELVATNESAAVAKTLFDSIVVESGEGDGCLSIPPVPIRAVGVRHPARWTIFSTNSSRPKNILGGGGGISPSMLDANVRPGCLSS